MPPLIVIVITVCIAVSLGIASYRLALPRQTGALAIESLEIEIEPAPESLPVRAPALEFVPAAAVFAAPPVAAIATPPIAAIAKPSRFAERVGVRLVLGLALALSLAAFFDSLAPRPPRAEDAACRR